jgi:hypothetical protein
MPEPVEPVGEVARRNIRLGLTLFAVFLVLFAGTIAVAFIYLAVD